MDKLMDNLVPRRLISNVSEVPKTERLAFVNLRQGILNCVEQ